MGTDWRRCGVNVRTFKLAGSEMRFAVFAGDTLVGHSALELGDPPMGLAFGRLFPTEDHRLIQHECRTNHAVTLPVSSPAS